MNKINICFKYLVFAIVCILPTVALAEVGNLNHTNGNAWTITAFGNGQLLYDSLLGIKSMTEAREFQGLMVAMGLLAVVVTGIAALGDYTRLPKMILVVFISWFIGLATFHFHVDAVVYDKAHVEISGSSVQTVPKVFGTIETVPAVIVIPAALIAKFGNHAASVFETHFSYPSGSSFKISEGASFSLSSSLLKMASSAKIVDPVLQHNFNNFYSDCYAVDLAAGNKNIRDLLTSTNIIGQLQPVQASLLTSLVAADGSESLVNCGTMYTDTIKASLEDNDVLSAMANQGGGAFLQATSTSLLTGHLSSAINLMGGGLTGGQAIAQSAVIDALYGSYEAAALATSNGEQMMALAMAQARQSQRTSWATGAEMFKELAGMTYSVLQVILMAITPLMLVALLIPQLGVSMIKNYVMMLVWMAFWEPLIAVCNYMQMGYIRASGTKNSGFLDFSMQNIGAVTDLANDASLYAGYAMALVPMISWALVKGTMAFTEFIASGIGNQFAASAASMAASGNVSLGNVNMNNTKANSFDSTFKTSLGNSGTTMAIGADAFKGDVNLSAVSSAQVSHSAQHKVEGSKGSKLEESTQVKSSESSSATAGKVFNRTTKDLQAFNMAVTKGKGVNGSSAIESSEITKLGQSYGESAVTKALENTESSQSKELMADVGAQIRTLVSLLKSPDKGERDRAKTGLDAISQGINKSLDNWKAKGGSTSTGKGAAMATLAGIATAASNAAAAAEDGQFSKQDEQGFVSDVAGAVSSGWESLKSGAEWVKDNPGSAAGIVALGAITAAAIFLAPVGAVAAGGAALATAGGAQLMRSAATGGLSNLFRNKGTQKATEMMVDGVTKGGNVVQGPWGKAAVAGTVAAAAALPQSAAADDGGTSNLQKLFDNNGMTDEQIKQMRKNFSLIPEGGLKFIAATGERDSNSTGTEDTWSDARMLTQEEATAIKDSLTQSDTATVTHTGSSGQSEESSVADNLMYQHAHSLATETAKQRSTEHGIKETYHQDVSYNGNSWEQARDMFLGYQKFYSQVNENTNKVQSTINDENALNLTDDVNYQQRNLNNNAQVPLSANLKGTPEEVAEESKKQVATALDIVEGDSVSMQTSAIQSGAKEAVRSEQEKLIEEKAHTLISAYEDSFGPGDPISNIVPGFGEVRSEGGGTANFLGTTKDEALLQGFIGGVEQNPDQLLIGEGSKDQFYAVDAEKGIGGVYTREDGSQIVIAKDLGEYNAKKSDQRMGERGSFTVIMPEQYDSEDPSSRFYEANYTGNNSYSYKDHLGDNHVIQLEPLESERELPVVDPDFSSLESRYGSP